MNRGTLFRKGRFEITNIIRWNKEKMQKDIRKEKTGKNGRQRYGKQNRIWKQRKENTNMNHMEQSVWMDESGSQGNASPDARAAAQGGGGNMQPPGGNYPMTPPPYTVVQGRLQFPDTEETKRLKENYGMIAPAAFAYAVFYAFCMYRNGSGITYPFFVGSSLLFFGFSFSKLGITLKKGSCFYMAAMLLLGVSTFCTDDGFIIFFNKLGVFLLLMSLLLKQFFDTSEWKLGKYLCSICLLIFASLAEWGRPVTDGAAYNKNREKKMDKRVWYFALGLLIGVPLLLAVLLLLASADAVFRQMAARFLRDISLVGIFNILFRITVLFFFSYGLTAYLCRRTIKEETPDRRKGEPVLAITVTGLLTVLYLLFSGIQIAGLFLGKLKLPEEYTYAMYAREGFFQLLAVSLLNLVIVLLCISLFRESGVLKLILTVMSFCTFVMIASSALRMIMYIRYYYLTYLRILVLWALALLAVLFAGVVISIFKDNFPLFRYQVAVAAVLYLALSFAHPDYIIAKVNLANTPANQGSFFLTEKPYQDYDYLRRLSADAAPALVPWLQEQGYHMEAFYEEDALEYASGMGFWDDGNESSHSRGSQWGFGYYWMRKMQQRTENFGIRTYNVSRHLALKSFEAK